MATRAEVLRSLSDDQLHQRQLELGTRAPDRTPVDAEVRWRRDKVATERFEKQMEITTQQIEVAKEQITLARDTLYWGKIGGVVAIGMFVLTIALYFMDRKKFSTKLSLAIIIPMAFVVFLICLFI